MSVGRLAALGLTKLNGTNMDTWKKDIMSFLDLEDLGDTINSSPPSDAVELVKWTKMDKKAYAVLHFTIEPEQCDCIRSLTGANAAWTALKSEFEKDTPATRMNLRQQFYSISHDPSIGVTPFITSVLAISRQLTDMGHAPKDSEITDKLLTGLHSSFSSIRTVLSTKTPPPSSSDITTILKDFERTEKLELAMQEIEG